MKTIHKNAVYANKAMKYQLPRPYYLVFQKYYSKLENIGQFIISSKANKYFSQNYLEKLIAKFLSLIFTLFIAKYLAKLI